ncbi:MAG: LEA type 2 family protein [Methylophagaceae bacterium]
MKKLFTIILLSLNLVACNSELIKQLVEVPQVRGIQLTSFSVEHKQAVFDVQLYNPNPFSLPISELNGDFKLNQLLIGSIAAESQQSLAANATQTVTFPISLDPNALVDAARSVFSTQKANYNFNGGITTPVGKLPFSTKGELSIKDVLSALIRSQYN